MTDDARPRVGHRVLPSGVWPVMLTPFREDRSIDWRGVDALVEFYLDAGVVGLFAVAQSAEMFCLTPDERVQVASRVVERVAGRVPVVAAGAFGGSGAEQGEAVRRMADTGVAAVVLIVNQLAAPHEGDDVWRSRAASLLEATDPIPLGLYECPAPDWRRLSVQDFAWAASTGRFVFHKDTSLDLPTIGAKVAATANTVLRFYNAEVESLLASLRAGGHGFSGICANFYPELVVRLCDPTTPADEAERLQRFLSVAEGIVDHKYPTSAKAFLRESGRLDIGPTCRTHVTGTSDHDLRRLRALADMARAMAGRE